jgi:hypothetical protein
MAGDEKLRQKPLSERHGEFVAGDPGQKLAAI